jgi:hypothetical protein
MQLYCDIQHFYLHGVDRLKALEPPANCMSVQQKLNMYEHGGINEFW